MDDFIFSESSPDEFVFSSSMESDSSEDEEFFFSESTSDALNDTGFEWSGEFWRNDYCIDSGNNMEFDTGFGSFQRTSWEDDSIGSTIGLS